MTTDREAKIRRGYELTRVLRHHMTLDQVMASPILRHALARLAEMEAEDNELRQIAQHRFAES